MTRDEYLRIQDAAREAITPHIGHDLTVDENEEGAYLLCNTCEAPVDIP